MSLFLPCRLLLSIAISSTMLAGCIDLSGSRNAYNYRTQQLEQHAGSNTTSSTKQSAAGEVHTMRGGLGIFSIGMNQLRDSVESRYRIPAYSTMWYNAGDVSRSIIASHRLHPSRPIILVGHSLGANEQIKVARNLNAAGVPVALLVTVDAVSQTIIPPNVTHALNFYKSGYVPMFSGLKLRAVDPQKTRIENINAAQLPGVTVNHFTIDKDKVVQQKIMTEIAKVLVNGK